jgi:uncharacterized protein (DUF697 family)
MQSKWWLNSVTVRAALLSCLPTALLLAKAFGVEIAQEEAESVVDGLAAIIGMVSAVMVIYGRFTAKEPISLEKK